MWDAGRFTFTFANTTFAIVRTERMRKSKSSDEMHDETTSHVSHNQTGLRLVPNLSIPQRVVKRASHLDGFPLIQTVPQKAFDRLDSRNRAYFESTANQYGPEDCWAEWKRSGWRRPRRARARRAPRWRNWRERAGGKERSCLRLCAQSRIQSRLEGGAREVGKERVRAGGRGEDLVERGGDAGEVENQPIWTKNERMRYPKAERSSARQNRRLAAQLGLKEGENRQTGGVVVIELRFTVATHMLDCQIDFAKANAKLV